MFRSCARQHTQEHFISQSEVVMQSGCDVNEQEPEHYPGKQLICLGRHGRLSALRCDRKFRHIDYSEPAEG